jgi:membrane associated rhomboid family serine protease
MKKEEKRKILRSIIFPALLVAMMWLVKGIEIIAHVKYSHYGIKPGELSGLIGILLSPFIHGSISHISANTLPFLVLGSLLFYIYRSIAWKVFILTWLITGIWVWFWARPSYHIGASGVVYGLASFLFFSGILRKDGRLMAVTFLVAFLYGSLVWGIFPDIFPEKNISWESHLMGLIAGLVMAFYFKKEGPQRRQYAWEFDDDDTDENDPEAYWNKPLHKKNPIQRKAKDTSLETSVSTTQSIQINYVYKKKESEDGEKKTE